MSIRIKILPEDVANKIAAGEVVERPASVVKELVENAFDAGAHDVQVTIRGGGRSSIRVVDDGSGMSRDDALLAFERHATSKLSDAADLFDIRTLGFRGEALAAISGVSILELTTRRQEDPLATRVLIQGGTLRTVSEVGAPVGTEISVRNLFFNTPARLKFLKSAAVETSHIVDLVTRLAISYETVGLRLTRGTDTLLQTSPVSEGTDRLVEVLGPDIVSHLHPFQAERAGLKVHGWMSAPMLSRSGWSGLYAFVNRRFTRDRVITKAVGEAYRGIIPKGRHPVVVVFLEVDPGDVDVNVHPGKIEVRFARPRTVSDLIIQSLRRTLTQAPWHPTPRTMAPQSAILEVDMSQVEAEPETRQQRDAAVLLAHDISQETGTAGPTSSRDPGGMPDEIYQQSLEHTDAWEQEAAAIQARKADRGGRGAGNWGYGAGGQIEPSPSVEGPRMPHDLEAVSHSASVQRADPRATGGAALEAGESVVSRGTAAASVVGEGLEAGAAGLEGGKVLGPAVPVSDVAGSSLSLGNPPPAVVHAPSVLGRTPGGTGKDTVGVMPSGTASRAGAGKDTVGGVPSGTASRAGEGPGILPGLEGRNFSRMRVIGQYGNCFILCQDGSELVIIDQHAAHERVTFEQLKAAYDGLGAKSQRLLTPIIVDLPRREAELLPEYLEELGALGLEVEPFGGVTFAIKAMPVALQEEDPVALLTDLASDLTADVARQPLHERIYLMLATLACHGSIRSSRKMGSAEMEALLKLLDGTDFSFACPHGRPLIIRMTRREVEKMFKRT